MTGCSVIGCKNRSERGFLMKKFPSDPKRRAEWISVVRGNRENWEPKQSSCVCEVHFESCMWEKQRVDGKRALKWNAIPTLVDTGEFPDTKFGRKQLQLQQQKLLRQYQQQQSILKNRLILPKPEVILQDNNPTIKEEILSSDGETKATGLEQVKVYVDPLHNYCRRGQDDYSSQSQSLLKSRQNKTATITNSTEKIQNYFINTTDKFHNYFSKKENNENQVRIQVQAPKAYIPIRPRPIYSNQLENSSTYALASPSDNENLNLPLECVLLENDFDEDFESENFVNNAAPIIKKSPSKINQIKEKYIFSRLNHVKCNDAACDRLHLQKERTINLLKKKIVSLRRENGRLLRKISEPNEMLMKVFNQDQVHAVGHKSTKWSSETIIKALELVIACGLKGYKEILRQNLPYPSIRTLQRKLDCDIS